MALAEFRKEIAILKACRDVNIVQFVVSQAKEIFLVLLAPPHPPSPPAACA
jgi:hypothetical protein